MIAKNRQTTTVNLARWARASATHEVDFHGFYSSDVLLPDTSGSFNKEHIIVAGAENHPPMLEKSMYDSWASRICLFIKWKKHGRMMLDSIDNVPLVYPTVEENRQTRPMKYSKLTKAQQLQDDCDV
nr:hypothetical protein [Tanacetum cinerariifolium]